MSSPVSYRRWFAEMAVAAALLGVMWWGMGRLHWAVELPLWLAFGFIVVRATIRDWRAFWRSGSAPAKDD